jgi:hypothetical protein
MIEFRIVSHLKLRTAASRIFARVFVDVAEKFESG